MALDTEVKVGDSPGKRRRSDPARPRNHIQHKRPRTELLNPAANVDAELNGSELSDHNKVKGTLRIFNKHYLHFVQDEEKRRKEVEAIIANSSKKNKKGKNNEGCISKSSKTSKIEDGTVETLKRASKRPDLKAISKMIEEGTSLNREKRIGHIPGIEVGHQFFSRAEMVVLGIHGHWLNGIDYMGKEYQKMDANKDKNYVFPLAVCIVLSGQYEDDTDNSDDVIYTGQGGHDLLGSKRQISDQKMVRGNLALKNNKDCNVPVRVVRGHESANSYCGKVYTYDGLYQVIKWWSEEGVSGYTIFKYNLRRLEGQPDLTTKQVHFSRAEAPKAITELRGLLCNDISGGQENFPIPVTNEVDDQPYPKDFQYRTSVYVPKGIKLPKIVAGCDCIGGCVDPKRCSCAKLNGVDFPYVCKDGGRLVEAKDVVFECGSNCSCDKNCVNKVSQHGLKYHLEVFRTRKKGWAVRSWDTIPSGAPVCEYVGELTRSDDLESAPENMYIFDIDCIQTMKGLDGRERRGRDDVACTDIEEKHSEPEYCINAGSVGNVARFINHSCEPNLFVQCILSSHRDFRMAKVMLFAADTIPPLQELTYDYGYALNSVVAPDGTVKKLACYCGSTECRKRLY